MPPARIARTSGPATKCSGRYPSLSTIGGSNVPTSACAVSCSSPVASTKRSGPSPRCLASARTIVVFETPGSPSSRTALPCASAPVKRRSSARRPTTSSPTCAGTRPLTARRYRFGVRWERSTFRSLSMEAAFTPSPVMRPVDQVRVSIVRAIASGQLRPGDRLPSEGEQARVCQVSRAAVREALRTLGEMGLLTTVQGRGGGSFVNSVGPDPIARNLGEAMDVLLHLDAINIAELLEARRALECVCARLAAERRSAAHLREIDDVMAAAREPGLSTESWLGLDVRFHRAVATSAENRVLMVPLSALHAIVQPRLNEAIRPLIVRDDIDAEHGAILAAIRDRDAAAATAAVERHIDTLESLYRRVGVL